MMPFGLSRPVLRTASALLMPLVVMGSTSTPLASTPLLPVTGLRGAASLGIDDKTVLRTLPSALPSQLSRPSSLPMPVRTNAWWSGGILEDWPAPLYALPTVTELTPDGTFVSLPGRQATDTTIRTSSTERLRVFVPDRSASKAAFRSAGDWDVTFRVYAGKQQLYDVTVAEGSPFVQFRSVASDLQIALPGAASVRALTCEAPCAAAVLVTVDAQRFIVASTGALRSERGLIRADGAASLTVAAVAPDADPAEYLQYLFVPVTGTRASYTVGDRTVRTTFVFGAKTLMGVFPHQASSLSSSLGTPVGTYDTVRGPVRLYAGSRFSTDVPRPPLLPSIPIPTSLKADRTFLDTLSQDITDSAPVTGDVYGAGKSLLRLAQLADIADQAGALSRATAVRSLKEQLSAWCGATPGSGYFAYDDRLGGLIGVPPAFGSEHYNDHHFHAGYFIHAAAILARLDPSFAKDYGDCIRLIIRDIASADRADTAFPYLRVFDPYQGHSWANGLTRFADGSNQESTSEAIQAWYAIALWGRTTGDADLERLGTWLMSQESVSARTYWFNVNRIFPADFKKSMISILWGGKADYSTFFDGSDAAIVGIQFFPISPALLGTVDGTVLSRVAAPAAVGASSIWTTTLRLAMALGGSPATIGENDPIDPGMSRSMASAWGGGLQALGAYRSDASVSPCAGAVFEKDGIRTVVIYRFANDPATCSVAERRSSVPRTVGNLAFGWNVRALPR